MFIITWIFDKLGFVPKQKENYFNKAVAEAWPFPAEKKPVVKAEPKTKPAVKKKPAVKRASTRKVK